MTHVPRTRLIFRVIIILLPAMLSACAAGLTGVESELSSARAKWAANQPNAYEITIRVLCFCPETRPVIVAVRAGAVESRRYADTGLPLDSRGASSFPAVEGLFAIVASAVERGAAKIDAQYDRARGFPVRIAIDYVANAVDDEITYMMSDFKAR